MDITPLIPAGRQVVDSYQPGRFRVSGIVHTGSIIVFPERTVPWPVADGAAITVDALADILGHDPAVEVLLIGCGPRIVQIGPAVRQALREARIGVDLMDTGAACRTYNVLLSEERRVAAALIAL